MSNPTARQYLPTALAAYQATPNKSTGNMLRACLRSVLIATRQNRTADRIGVLPLEDVVRAAENYLVHGLCFGTSKPHLTVVR